jgi:hypothetical protein
MCRIDVVFCSLVACLVVAIVHDAAWHQAQDLREKGPFLVHSYRSEDDITGLGRVWVHVAVGEPPGYHSAVIKFEFECNAVESVQISGYVAEDEGCD